MLQSTWNRTVEYSLHRIQHGNGRYCMAIMGNDGEGWVGTTTTNFLLPRCNSSDTSNSSLSPRGGQQAYTMAMAFGWALGFGSFIGWWDGMGIMGWIDGYRSGESGRWIVWTPLDGPKRQVLRSGNTYTFLGKRSQDSRRRMVVGVELCSSSGGENGDSRTALYTT